MNFHVKSVLVKKYFMALSLVCFFGMSITAQDRTPAKAYNEGLAELKAKNYEAGLTLMEEALTLSEEGKDDLELFSIEKRPAMTMDSSYAR